MLTQSRHFGSFRTLVGRWRSGQNRHIVDLLQGASIAGGLKAVSAVLGFALSVVLARALGADLAGLYFLALTTATIAATIGRVGLDSAVIRFIAGHASTSRWAEVRNVNRAAIAIGLVCSSVIAALLCLGGGLLADKVFGDPNLATPIRVMALAVIPLALGVLVSRALQGLSLIRDSVLVFSILPSGVTLLGTWLLAARWGVEGAIVAYIVGTTAALLYGWVAWRRALARRVTEEASTHGPRPTRELLKSGSPLLVGELLQLVMQLSGTIMLGIWATTADVSVFSVASRTAVLITFVLIAVNTIAQPKFAELYARREMDSLAATARKATLLMTVCAAPVLAVFLAAPTFVMNAFGHDFASGASTLQILSIGQFINVATGSVGVLLVMSGHEREYRNTQIVAAGVVLALNFVLIPPYGAVGAAAAAAVALIVQNVLFGYFVWARLGILTFTPKTFGERSVRGG